MKRNYAAPGMLLVAAGNHRARHAGRAGGARLHRALAEGRSAYRGGALPGGDHRERATSSRCMWSSAFPASPSPTAITTPPRCSRPPSAAACPRASSRRCASSAASSIRSIPSPLLWRWRHLRHLCRHRRGRGGGADAGAVRRDAEARRRPSSEELARARAQLKAGLLMSLEGTAARCEQQASHMLIYGRPLDPQELVGHIDAVDEDAVMRVAKRILAGKPTLAALGPIGKLEKLELFAERLRSNGFSGARGWRSICCDCNGSSGRRRRPFAWAGAAPCCARPTGSTGAPGPSCATARARS